MQQPHVFLARAFLLALHFVACTGDGSVPESKSDGSSESSDSSESDVELVIPEEMVLCGYNKDDTGQYEGTDSLARSVAMVMKLKIGPGRYVLPPPGKATMDNTRPPSPTKTLELDVALEDTQGPIAFEVESPFEAKTIVGTYTVFEFNEDRFNVRIEGTLRTANGELWRLIIVLNPYLYTPDLEVVELRAGDREGSEDRYVTVSCHAENSESGFCFADSHPNPLASANTFFECSLPWQPTETWNIEYPGGVVTFEQQIWSTRFPESGNIGRVVQKAYGTHDDVVWMQDDLFKMTAPPNCNSYPWTLGQAPFVALFPTPIGDACGIATKEGYEQLEDGTYRGFREVYTFDCDYRILESVEATSESAPPDRARFCGD